MNIKVGDTIYEGNKEPVMVILHPDDKKNIAGMADDECSYANYPNGWTKKQSREWMADRKKKHIPEDKVLLPDGNLVPKEVVSKEN